MPEPPAETPAHAASTAPGAAADSVIETLQSLIVAFVLAMTFRGFVTEGFVIPTGSMAPTLKGQHLLFRSEQSGSEFAVGLHPDEKPPPHKMAAVADPMLGRRNRDVVDLAAGGGRRMGDRILVLKCLYPFMEPQRFDVVVFKNPTDPTGDSANYIKRLIGLPDEKIWLVDGDVFAGPVGTPGLEGFAIQRKPEHVQRAVWQPVYGTDFAAARPEDERLGSAFGALPWSAVDWDLDGSSYRHEGSAATTLHWKNRTLDDWAPYNQITDRVSTRTFAVSDLRVAAGIVADQAGLVTSLELLTRERLFFFTIDAAAGEATVSIRRDGDDPSVPVVERSGEFRPRGPGRVLDVEFWHVDQRLSIYVDGDLVVSLDYDWGPVERIELSTGGTMQRWLDLFPHVPIEPPSMQWHFEGSPVTLHRVSVDRDLYYRPDDLSGKSQQNRRDDGTYHTGPARGTHPEQLAKLGPDHFFMLGDNSAASSDSRMWGDSHPLVKHQIDDTPFVVNRKLLLGKAWVVYFPAPYPVGDGGRSLIPDFGRLRFIR